MAYVTLDQLTDRYGARMLIDLTDRGAVATGAIDPDTVSRAIADAASRIDGHLAAARYSLPVAEVPPLLTDLAAKLTIWNLHTYDPPQKIADDYKDAVRQLEQVAQGTIRLPLPSGAEPASSGDTGARVTDRDRPFTATNLKGFI